MEKVLETLHKKNININYWLTQWENMQNAYLPYRNYRFDFIINLTKYLFKNRTNIKILDIGCGPLSFSSKFLDYWENIKIIGIDYHPILYWLGSQKYKNNKNIELKLIDIRNDEDFTKIDSDNFDLIITSTALHWFSINNLAKIIKKLIKLLKKNGYFINIDHIKNENNDIQKYVDNERNKITEKELKKENTKNWKNYFEDFYKKNNLLKLKEAIDENFGEWEGIEEGLTYNEFKKIMSEAGYKEIDCVWQYLNDRIIIAKK